MSDQVDNLNWYDEQARRIAAEIYAQFGIKLDDKQIKAIRDCIYRQVINARVGP